MLDVIMNEKISFVKAKIRAKFKINNNFIALQFNQYYPMML